ncbi:hypothetical protein BH24CHL6_BH24CHL6_08190 [soil metagenome]
MHRGLTEAATEWQRANWEPSLLYRGARLAAALDWARLRFPASPAKPATPPRNRRRVSGGPLSLAVGDDSAFAGRPSILPSATRSGFLSVAHHGTSGPPNESGTIS